MLDLQALVGRLDSLGLSPGEMVQASRRASANACPPYISPEDWTFFSVLEQTAQVNPPAIGLKLGSFWQADLAIYKNSQRRCASLAETNRAVKKHLSSSYHSQFYHDTVEGREWRMAFATRFPPSATSTILVDEILARAKHELEYLTGDNLSIKRVEMSMPAPRHKAVYEDFFCCPVIWGRPYAMIVVDESYLYRSCITLDSDQVEVPACHEPDGSAPSELSFDIVRITSAIMELLIFSPGRYPSLDRVARMFDVSPSSVKRRLMKSDVTYRELVDEVRRDYVAQYLSFSQLPPKEIAHWLGFTNVHNFRRAFSRWMGQTPSQYRQVARSANAHS